LFVEDVNPNEIRRLSAIAQESRRSNAAPSHEIPDFPDIMAKLAIFFYETEGLFKDAAQLSFKTAQGIGEADSLHASVLYEKAAMFYALQIDIESSKDALEWAVRLNPRDSIAIRGSLVSVIEKHVELVIEEMQRDVEDFLQLLDSTSVDLLKYGAEVIKESDPRRASEMLLTGALRGGDRDLYEDSAKLLDQIDPQRAAVIRQMDALIVEDLDAMQEGCF
jgi:hypothetical protein